MDKFESFLDEQYNNCMMMNYNEDQGEAYASSLIEALNLDNALVEIPIDISIAKTAKTCRHYTCLLSFERPRGAVKTGLRYVIQHLNDAHLLTFAEIADIIEELAQQHQLDLTIN